MGSTHVVCQDDGFAADKDGNALRFSLRLAGKSAAGKPFFCGATSPIWKLEGRRVNAR
jgi:hypothetical protein